ncbi:MAG TPA: phosphohistidine phosphatase SixA [Vicinamibacterales bacterium]|nr:phosphohistidine phosphatase SixA [Vicinamibacterales bacterium]
MAATIELFLVRHAIAAERGPNYPDDRERPLTDEGITRFKTAVEGLKSLDVKIELVLTSPLVRASHTAELLAASIGGKPRIEPLEALAPGGRLTQVLDAVAKFAKRARHIALVGHEPDLGELAARLLRARGTIEFKKGAVCCLELDGAMPAGPGTLRWLIPPRALRKIHR